MSDYEHRFILNEESRERVLEKFCAFVRQLGKGGWELTAKRFRNTRSDEQNKALWGLAYKLLSQHTGYRVDELHEYACGEYFGWETYEIFGKPKKRPKRTTTTDENGKRSVISTTEFAGFLEFVQQLGAQAGVYIPDPDPDWKERG